MSNQSDAAAANIGASIKFAGFVDFLERLSTAKTVPQKIAQLRKYYASFCEFRQQFCERFRTNPLDDADNSSFFPVLRLLLPALDAERDACGLQTTMLGKLLVRLLAVDAASDVGRRLMRRQHEGGGGGGGDIEANDQRLQRGVSNVRQRPADYADIVYGVMRQRATVTAGSAFTIAVVNERLDRISQYYQENRRKCE